MDNRNDTRVLVSLLGFCLGLFILDLHLPLGVADGVLYSGAVILAFASSRRNLPLLVAAASSVLIVLGAILGPTIPGVPTWMAISNRFFSVMVLWVPVLFFLQQRRAEESLHRAYEGLDQRVRERTAELEKVNKALVEEITERAETERSLLASEEALGASQGALEQSQDELRALAARLLTAQEEERRRISRDLHDDINQRLAMLAVDVETLQKRIPATPEWAGRSMQAIQDKVIELSDDIRHLAYQFHPSVLDDLGLPVALQRLIDDFSVRTGIKASFSTRSLHDPFTQECSACLYRLTQESLGNVARHAKASEVQVELAGSEKGTRLSIRDNGVGFDAERMKEMKTGLGLVSMKERVRLVNGVFSIQSQRGQGTQVQVWVPLQGDPHGQA